MKREGFEVGGEKVLGRYPRCNYEFWSRHFLKEPKPSKNPYLSLQKGKDKNINREF